MVGSELEDDVFDDEQPKVLNDTIPAIENSSFSVGEFELVGHGEVGSANCGKVVTLKGCLRTELHNRITIDGEDYRGKVFVRRVRFSCGKPSCPICYKRSWAVREARRIELRLAEASKRFGLVEHIVVGVPSKFWFLSFEYLRRKAVEVLISRGVVGGVLIFHAFRYNNSEEARSKNQPFGWYWSPHFHVLGFILHGYKCRGCPKCVKGCGHFVDRNYRLNEKDGYYVKVLGKRKTVGGTAWYQLNHASVKKGSTRFHVATWFGICSYRKLKVTVEKHKDLCPICKHELINIRYFGSKCLNLTDEGDSFEDFEEDGRVVWFERVKAGSYG
jgi:hypothetical protein